MFLNVVELAESLGVEESMIDSWVREDALPHVVDRGRLLFDRAEVVAWATARGLVAKVGFLAPPPATAVPGRDLRVLLRTGGIWRNVPATEVPQRLAERVSQMPGVTPNVRQLLQLRLATPGGISWAPVGRGLALPHLRAPVALGRDSGLLALLLLQDTLPLGEPAPDNLPIRRLAFFVAPSPRAHLELLGQLSTALTRGRLRQLILEDAPDDEIYAALAPLPAPRQTPEEGS